MRILSIITLPGFLVGRVDFANDVSLAATSQGGNTAAVCTLRGYKRGGGQTYFYTVKTEAGAAASGP
jgi:hypothetical protein